MIEAKGASPASTPTSATVITSRPFSTDHHQESIRVVQEHPSAAAAPTVIPALNQHDEHERIEKRNFILTLSMADLAGMTKADLVEFYEYLSPEEIAELESRHSKAVEESEEAKEKAKIRDQFLAMSLDEMEELNPDELDYYMRFLGDLDRKETEEKLAKSADEKRRKRELEEEERRRREQEEQERLRRQAEEERLRLEAEENERVRLEAEEQERLQEEHRRAEEECIRLEIEEQERVRLEAEEQERLRREAEEELLRRQAEEERLRIEAEEQERLRLEFEEQERLRLELEEQERQRHAAEEERLRQEAREEEERRRLQEIEEHEAQRRRHAEALFALEDRDLVHLHEDELAQGYAYLTHDQADTLRQRYEKLSNMRRLILEASDEDLTHLGDGEFEHYAHILSPTEAEFIRERRKEAIDKKKKQQEEEKEVRKTIFALSNVELASMDPGRLEAFGDVLSAEEIELLRQRRMETLEAREGILSLDADTLRSLERGQLEAYYR